MHESTHIGGDFMKTVGLPISRKENELRRALIPAHVRLMKKPEMLYFEKGYGEILGYSDSEYLEAGSHIVSREETLGKDIICALPKNAMPWHFYLRFFARLKPRHSRQNAALSAYLLCTVQMKKTVGILRYLPSFSMVEISGFEPLTS